jgi:hypothetical protein
MWEIVGISLIGAVISLLEIPPLLKKKWRREMIVFLTLLLMGLTLSILLSKKISIPNPTDFIVEIYKPVANFVERILS